MAEEQLSHLQGYLARASAAYQLEIVRLRQALAAAGGGGGDGAGGEGGGVALQLPPLAR
jgi:hypothetical protein